MAGSLNRLVTVREYAEAVEQNILDVFQTERLVAASYGCRQGPHTLTFALRLVGAYDTQGRPVAVSDEHRRKALKLGPMIEMAIRDTEVRVEERKGFFYVQVPSNKAVPVQAESLQGEGFKVPVGLTTVRKIRGVDFANPGTAHLVIVAGTGRGKTTVARSILYGLVRQNSPDAVQIAVCTFKPPDWEPFAGLPHLAAVETEPKEIGRILEWARQEVYLRSKTGANSPRWVIVLDDMYNWGSLIDVSKAIGEIASLGRAAGIHLVIITQKIAASGMGKNTAAVSNIGTRIVLGATSASEAALFTGVAGTGAEKLGRYWGDGILVAIGAPTRLACASVTNEAIVALGKGQPSGPPGPVPWLSIDKNPERPGAGNMALVSLLNRVGKVPIAGPGPRVIIPPAPPTTALVPVSLDTVSSEASTGSDSGTDIETDSGTDSDGGAEALGLTLPLERIDPPTPEQAAVIARVWAETGGLMNQTLKRCYGAKNKRTRRLLLTALEMAGVEDSDEDEDEGEG